MNRIELERLDRDSLIARAEQQGVTRARILTRPELIDELLVKATGPDDPMTQRARGFFGRARDLLARIIDRGLHLPEAADMVRSKSTPPPALRGGAAALPTVTLAEIYAAQGHRTRALDTLRKVLEGEPEHEAARAMLSQLEDVTYRGPDPVLPPESEEEASAARGDADEDEDDGPRVAGGNGHDVRAGARHEPRSSKSAASGQSGHGGRGPAMKPEPMGMLDDAPLPPKDDVNECVAIPVDPTTLFVYWEVRDQTREHLERTRPGGVVALRVLVIEPTWDGPTTMVRDQDVGASLGDFFVRGLPIGAVVRAAIGWRVGDVFVSISHSPALETPPGKPSDVVAEGLMRWTPRGAIPIEPGQPEALAIARALGRARAQAAGHGPVNIGTFGSLGAAAAGSSERMLGAS
jgi:hypothetical protein